MKLPGIFHFYTTEKGPLPKWQGAKNLSYSSSLTVTSSGRRDSGVAPGLKSR